MHASYSRMWLINFACDKYFTLVTYYSRMLYMVVALVVVVVLWCPGVFTQLMFFIPNDPPNDRTADRLPAWGPNAWLFVLYVV